MSRSLIKKEHLVSAFLLELKAVRMALGMSQKELSDITGIRQSHLSRIESGQSNVTLDTLVQILMALESTIFIDVFNEEAKLKVSNMNLLLSSNIGL